MQINVMCLLKFIDNCNLLCKDKVKDMLSIAVYKKCCRKDFINDFICVTFAGKY